MHVLVWWSALSRLGVVCRREAACCSSAQPNCRPVKSHASPFLPAHSLRSHSLLRRDKRVVKEPGSEADIWWGAGSPNYEMDER